jgi:hypothetical protein
MVCRLSNVLLPIGLALMLALSTAQLVSGGLAANGAATVTAIASLLALILTLRRPRAS